MKTECHWINIPVAANAQTVNKKRCFDLFSLFNQLVRLFMYSHVFKCVCAGIKRWTCPFVYGIITIKAFKIQLVTSVLFESPEYLTNSESLKIAETLLSISKHIFIHQKEKNEKKKKTEE